MSSKSKPIARSRRQHTPVESSVAERNEMFSFWYDANRNYSATANKFRIAVTTLRRYAKADRWEKRADDIDKKVREAVDKEVARAQVSNVRIAQAMLVKELKKYESRKATGSLYGVIALMRYIDNANEVPPPPTPTGNAVPLVGVLPANFFAGLSPDQLAQYDADTVEALTRRSKV